ncbi:FUSC family protein [Paracoccus sp. MBLB3053]|uniref:FUSC family protein n=1 Tax=Paracoccus aurantius TaxID=3073814 RepID=A0ABU2HZD5_9RHOB|nr:FUSC family protein [Paracoccus sp. MBLB3053]MDS9470117.1 FUSC family protein [Paracoccus sp. MBLB3053]
MTSAGPGPELRPSAERPTGRIEAMRHLMMRHHLRDSFALGKQPFLYNSGLAGLQAGLTVAIALPLINLSPWPHLIGFGSLGALIALFGRFAPHRDRSRVVLACGFWQVMAVLVMSTTALLGAPLPLQFALLALSCGFFFFVAVTGSFGPPGALIFVFAAGASMGQVGSPTELLERVSATAVVAALAWMVCRTTETLRRPAPADRAFPAEPYRPIGHRLFAAGRIVAGSAVAIFASHAFGADHPAWAAMGALAVMQGSHLHISLNRALQRMVGTILGAILAWLILFQGPSLWAIICALFLLQFATEMIIGANYGLGQVLVTPMALLMSHLAAPHVAGAAMAPERILDTLLGVCVGMACAVLFSSNDDRRYLARHNAEKTGTQMTAR